MRVPHKVWVKGRVWYLIVWVDRFDGDDCWGQCCSDTRHIYLLKGMRPTRLAETFIHEWLHAIEFEYKIPIPHAIVDPIATAVARLLKRNGVVFEEPR